MMEHFLGYKMRIFSFQTNAERISASQKAHTCIVRLVVSDLPKKVILRESPTSTVSIPAESHTHAEL